MSSMVPAARRRSLDLGTWVARLLLLLLAVVWVLPIAWAVDTSIKPEGETVLLPPSWIPRHFTLLAYKQVLQLSGLLRWYFNSAVVSVIVTAAVLLICSLAGYAFSRLEFPGRRILYWVALAGIMVPGQILVIPLFLMMTGWHMVNTYGGIILPQLISPIGVFIMRQFFNEIPSELEEAARIDGASRITIFLRIAVPLSRSALAALGIFTFVWSWNNFLWPLIVESSESMMTIPIGLSQVQSGYGIQYAQIMASAVLASVPILIVFAIFQRQIIEGISLTGLKG